MNKKARSLNKLSSKSNHNFDNPQQQQAQSYQQNSQHVHNQIQQSAPSLHKNRLKFRYTITQKPKTSHLNLILILTWLAIFILLLFSSYTTKLKNLHSQSTKQQNQCKLQYQRNRCGTGIKSIAAFCQEKKLCFQANSQQYYHKKIQVMFIVGQIVRDFAEGAGIYVCIGGLVIIWVFSKAMPNKEIKKQYTEYYQ